VYGLILTAVNLVATYVFFSILDRDRVIGGATMRHRPRAMPRSVRVVTGAEAGSPVATGGGI
jgi:hypothetical protein